MDTCEQTVLHMKTLSDSLFLPPSQTLYLHISIRGHFPNCADIFEIEKNLSFLTLAIKSVLNLQIIKYKTFDRAMEQWNTMEYNNEEGVPKKVWCSKLY